ncbi:MAG: hypothetical protein ACE5LG_01445 [Anaerolineae bacterium]
MKRTILLLGLILSLGILYVFSVACAPALSQVLPQGSPTPGGAKGTPVPMKIPLPEGNPLIVFRRSGGLAGVSESWFIYEDGRVVYQEEMKGESATGEIEAQELAGLLALIEETGFFSFSDSYLPQNICCDRFSYGITVFKDGQSKTVTTVDGAEAPEGLWTIIGELNELLAGMSD